MTGNRKTRAENAAKLRRYLDLEGPHVAESLQHYNRLRYQSTGDLGSAYPRLKSEAREIKEDAINRIPELIETVTRVVESRGGHVHVASTAAKARAYVLDVYRDNEERSAVKSKSMTCAEIDLRETLAEAGCEVTETDLGELVLQLADETPSHLVGPSVHLSREEIADCFAEAFDLDSKPEDATALTELARDYVGEQIREADIGITGANFVVADTGSIALITNEGNARKVVESTNTLITVAGIEKLLPSLTDLSPFVQLVGRSAGESAITAYTSVFSPPIDTPPYPFEGDEEDREFHLVLLDNGRMDMRDDDELREALYCVRCGACSDSCANFQHVGGHAFGGETYTGGIAPSWEAGVQGTDAAAFFVDLCTGCSRCVNQCPVQIDIPWLNAVLRRRLNAMDGAGSISAYFDAIFPDEEPDVPPFRKRLFGNFETLARVASRFAPVSNAVIGAEPTKRAFESLFGIDDRRNLPAFQRRTFRDWASNHQGTPARADHEYEAVLYPDLYTQYVLVQRGRAAVEALEALGVEVAVPAVGSSGRPALSQGMMDTARERAETVVKDLRHHIETGRDVVVIEPSDVAMFLREYERLLPEEEFELLSANTFELMQYVEHVVDSTDADLEAVRTRAGDPGRVVYHRNCQHRTVGLAEPTVVALTSLGYDVRTTEVECCGMAGSFGYKTEFYELSMAVGEDVAEQIRSADGDVPILASGMSCVKQIDDLVASDPVHPIEYLRGLS